MAITISVITILVLLLNNEVCKPRLAKFSRIPVPIELIGETLHLFNAEIYFVNRYVFGILVVVSGTLMAKYSSIVNTWDLEVIGQIPIGFPGNIKYLL